MGQPDSGECGPLAAVSVLEAAVVAGTDVGVEEAGKADEKRNRSPGFIS
jgi:hypothetical protein